MHVTRTLALQRSHDGCLIIHLPPQTIMFASTSRSSAVRTLYQNVLKEAERSVSIDEIGPTQRLCVETQSDLLLIPNEFDVNRASRVHSSPTYRKNTKMPSPAPSQTPKNQQAETTRHSSRRKSLQQSSVSRTSRISMSSSRTRPYMQ